MAIEKPNPQNNEDIFKKVHISEKKNLYLQFVQEKSLLLAMGSEDSLFQLIPESVDQDRYLICSFSSDSPSTDISQEVIINFSVGEQRYFMISLLSMDRKMARIDINPDLFVLQRRKTARLKIPQDYPATMTFMFYNGAKVFFEGRMLDFSSGGCKVEIKVGTPEITIGDRFKGSLNLGARRSFNMQGQVRHVVTEVVDNKVHQVFGIQFGPMDKAMETKLITVFMDLQREVFMNFSKK